MKSTEAIELIVKEFGRQAKNEQPFLDLEEGLEAIEKETNKIFDEVYIGKTPDYTPDKELIKDAAVKTAANAFRFLVDLC